MPLGVDPPIRHVTDDSPHWILLERYLAGELGPDERARFERWVALSPERQAWVESLRTITRRTGDVLSGPTSATGAAWQRAARRLGLDQSTGTLDNAAHTSSDALTVAWAATRTRVAGRKYSYRSLRSTGGVFIAAALAASIMFLVVSLGRSILFQTTTGRRYATAAGQRETVKLADGTECTLGPSTVLTVGPGYGRSERTVALEGEASFTVTHDARRPFTVRTPWATTSDLGTSFVVRAYPDDHRTRVAVREGAVALTPTVPQGPTVTLRAGDAATVDATGRQLVRHIGHHDSLFAWASGEIVFSDTPLADVMRDLSRAFDLQIVVDDTSLERLTVTASFTNQPVDTVLDDITAIVGAQYAWSGRTVTIQRRSKTASPHRITRPPLLHAAPVAGGPRS